MDYEKVFESDWKLLGTIYGQQNDTDIDYWYLGSPSGSQQIEQPNYGTTWQISHGGDLGEMPNRFTLGVEAIQQDFRAESDYGFGLSVLEADNWTVSVFAQDTLTVLESLDLTAGVRYDHREWDLFVTGTGDLDRHADVWSPRLAAHYRWADRTSTWVSLSRAFRLPTGNEIGAVGVFDGQPFFPNPSIDPIAANTIEIGTRVDRWALLGGSLVYYYSHVEDDIILNPFTFQNENFNSNRQGIELTLTSRPAEWLDLYYTTAYTDARFDGGAYDDNRLPLVPEWQLTGGVNWRPAAGWQLTFETIYLAGQRPTNDLDNLFDENEFVVCNLKIRYARDHWTVFAAANNLFDELYETYPLSNGSTTRKYNPAPGFNFQAGASVTF